MIDARKLEAMKELSGRLLGCVPFDVEDSRIIQEAAATIEQLTGGLVVATHALWPFAEASGRGWVGEREDSAAIGISLGECLQAKKTMADIWSWSTPEQS